MKVAMSVFTYSLDGLFGNQASNFLVWVGVERLAAHWAGVVEII